MKRVMLLGLALATATATPAMAQNMAWSTIIPSVTGTDVLGQHLRQLQAPPAAGATAGRGLRYTPSPARRRANLDQFVARARAVDPGGAASLAQLFASGDIVDRIAGVIAPLGLRVDDLADTYALWWVAAWQASQGANPTPSRATMQAVRGQVARALAATPALLGADDAARQTMAEALMIQALLLDGMVEGARRPEELRAIAGAARQGAAGMGLDLSRMRLTEAGFVPN